MKVILICGKARSGKNQLATYLAEYLDVNKTLIRGNADSVKEIAYEHFNWNGEKDAKGRQLLIDITNDGYAKDIHYWEKTTFKEAVVFTNKQYEYLIIPDWRYAQTLDYFRKVATSVTTIRVVRPNLPEGTHKYHVSENALDLFDVQYEVLNDKDLDNLKKVAKELCSKM